MGHMINIQAQASSAQQQAQCLRQSQNFALMKKLPLEIINIFSKGHLIMKNILVNYLYRDATNTKAYGSVLFHSKLSDECLSILKTALISNASTENFVPEDMGLPCLRESYDEEIDHSLHEIEEIELVKDGRDCSKETYFIFDKAITDCSFEEFVTVFLKKDTKPDSWNVYEPSFEEYSGPGFQKPSAKEVKDLLEILKQQQTEAPQAI